MLQPMVVPPAQVRGAGIMSVQAAQAFIERMKTDEVFRARVTAAESPGEFLEFVEAEGFDCGAEEIAAQVSRLEDADLEAIAAGDAKSQESVNDPWGVLRYTQGYS
jgi:predicted ribosomally synthesized peptide with nif11-like leader